MFETINGIRPNLGIFKGRDAVEFQFGGFVFGEQVRDEEGLIRFYIVPVGYVVAQFEFFHHVHDEEAFAARIFRGYKNFTQSFLWKTMLRQWDASRLLR